MRDAPDAICWVTWDEINAAIAPAAAGHRNVEAATLTAVHRMVAGVRGAIDRHG